MVHNEELYLHAMHSSPAKLSIVGNDDGALAMVYLTEPNVRKRTPKSMERARRLLACWNALVGLSTEDIEAMAVENKTRRAQLAQDEALESATRS